MHLIIVGRGELANAIVKTAIKEKISYSFWENRKNTRKAIVLYCGSERLFKEVSLFCKATQTPLVLLSTDVSYSKRTPFPFFFTPNTSSEVLSFIKQVSDFARETEYTAVSIIESHQATKKDISGTAKQIARILGEPDTIITSIRDPQGQLELGIPKKHLTGHAYHRINFKHSGVITNFTILVLGRETYAKGAIKIAREVLRSLK